MEIRQIRQYQFHERLGYGAHGETWLAMDAAVQRPVVIKFLPGRLVANDVVRHRFLEPMDRLGKLDGYAALYGLDTENDQPFLVRQYIDGRSLAEYGHARPVEYHQFLELSRELARTVATAHLLEIPLLNLTPHNIIIDSAGKMHLTDICLPWRPADQPPARLARAAGFRSPEQFIHAATGGDEPGIQTDMFSIGAIMYELLTGRPAFAFESVDEVEDHVIRVSYDLDASDTGRMSTDMHLLLPNLLAAKPDDRMEVTTLLASLEGMISYLERQPTVEVKSVKSGASQRYMQIAVLVALVVIFTLVISGFYR